MDEPYLLISWFLSLSGIELKGGVTEGCVTEQSGFLKNVSLNKFRKIAYIKWFFNFLRHFKHNFAIKASTFTKLGDFSLKYRNLPKFSAIGYWTRFFPKFSKSSHFSAPSAPKKWSPNGQSHPPPPFGGSPPPMQSLIATLFWAVTESLRCRLWKIGRLGHKCRPISPLPAFLQEAIGMGDLRNSCDE